MIKIEKLIELLKGIEDDCIFIQLYQVSDGWSFCTILDTEGIKQSWTFRPDKIISKTEFYSQLKDSRMYGLIALYKKKLEKEFSHIPVVSKPHYEYWLYEWQVR